MTKDNWIKALHKIATDYVLSKSQSGPYDLVFSCDEEVKDLENLLYQVEKDAIEKTNKRWRKLIESMEEDGYGRANQRRGDKDKYEYTAYCSGYNQALSDLLDEK